MWAPEASHAFNALKPGKHRSAAALVAGRLHLRQLHHKIPEPSWRSEGTQPSTSRSSLSCSSSARDPGGLENAEQATLPTLPSWLGKSDSTLPGDASFNELCVATELELSDCGRNVDSLPELAPDCGVKQLDLGPPGRHQPPEWKGQLSQAKELRGGLDEADDAYHPPAQETMRMQHHGTATGHQEKKIANLMRQG
eukprot:CAMPEP_0181455162 /NCGR_PEP_ID=MMETSP1110-20121109/30614_1 /TAXON_ID=174948 /ORGANISM="Symbiodinium sp., Strain CCMP421" /LENGTH=195 /DNA_ID=CAMNT_0023579535 /DNA_START=21 /DNA_END=611 /DNA_ORIENTATION=+